MRRMMNRELSEGFSAWQQLWSAKVYALSRLRDGPLKLR